MPTHRQRPGYADLMPAQVLDALDAAGLRPDGRILQLNSYENRVHQVFLEDGSAVVTKFYRPGRWSDAQILEEHAFERELAAAEIGVVAPLVLRDAGTGMLALHGDPPTLASFRSGDALHRFSVAPRCAGREPELDDPATLRQIGRLIGRVHLLGRHRPFVHRHRLDASADAHAAQAALEALDMVPDTLRPAWEAASRQAIDVLVAAFAGLPDVRWLRLHGDCHRGNVLWRDGGARLVDLDDACQGPAVQDLWMLVSGGDGLSLAGQLGHLLDGYEQFAEFDYRELALIEPLRTLRMVRHSAWLAERWIDPAFPAAFPYFGTEAYWSQQIAQLREQLEAMDQPPPRLQ